MEDDVSRSTVIVLVLLTLTVSAIGTWVVLSSMPASVPEAPDTGQGEVVLSLDAPPLSQKASTDVGGEVALTILERR